VVTAGHCVHEGEGGDFFDEVDVNPGMNGPLQPFGKQTSKKGKLRTSDGWEFAGSMALDYGAIILDAPFQSASGVSPGNFTI
jgi:V8-like Glu-specific endopeptidase